MNQWRNFAGQDGASTTEIVPGSGYTKDGKEVVPPQEKSSLQRWGIWSSASGYFDGRNIAAGSVGTDYRIKPHWLLGGYATYWYNRHGLFQAGVYTAWVEKHWWTVLGSQYGWNDFTGYASTGYDFALGNFLIGPMVAIQFDSASVDQGFGKGNLLQERAGIHATLAAGRFVPEVDILWQGQSIDVPSGRSSSIWASAGTTYFLNDKWSVFGYCAFQGNSNWQEIEPTVGFRMQF